MVPACMPSILLHNNLQGVPSASPLADSPSALDIHSDLPWLQLEAKHSDFKFALLSDYDLAEYDDLLEETETGPSECDDDEQKVFSVAGGKFGESAAAELNVAFEDTQTTIYEEDMLDLEFSSSLVPVAKQYGASIEEGLLSLLSFVDDEDDKVAEQERAILHTDDTELEPDRESADGSEVNPRGVQQDDFTNLGELSTLEDDSSLKREESTESTVYDELDDLLSLDGLYELSATPLYTHDSTSELEASVEPANDRTTLSALEGIRQPSHPHSDDKASFDAHSGVSEHTTLSVPEPTTQPSDTLPSSTLPCVILEYQSSFYCLFQPYSSDLDADVLFRTSPCRSLWTVDKLGSELSEVFGITADVVVEFPSLELSFSPKSVAGATMRLQEVVRMHEGLEGSEAPLKMLLLECRNSFEERWGYLQNLIESRKRKHEVEDEGCDGRGTVKATRVQ
ncbi:hypothetical protein BJ742DRAFT_779447 [Cladochytrium replicatum]|nr:hypothetical protein BJ742DRAFT_779447 [Cladochytrium replicatum]